MLSVQIGAVQICRGFLSSFYVTCRTCAFNSFCKKTKPPKGDFVISSLFANVKADLVEAFHFGAFLGAVVAHFLNFSFAVGSEFFRLQLAFVHSVERESIRNVDIHDLAQPL